MFILISNIHPQSYETVTIFAIEIPGLHQRDGNGKYDKILKSIPGINYTIIYLTARRVFAEFYRSSNCAISPANLNPEFYSWDFNVVETSPMGIASIHIFSPKGEPVISSINDLIGKRVGIRFGMPYGKTLENINLILYQNRSIVSNIRMLDINRIDYMVEYIPDAYEAFRSLNLEPYPFDIDRPIAVHPDSLVCKDVSRDFINAFNSEVTK